MRSPQKIPPNSTSRVANQKLRLKRSRRGFTLIELLMVIAIISILAAITFGISTGVRNTQARAKAKAELAVISQAIEQFKARYGDYPWHDSDRGDDTNQMLLFALTGRMTMSTDTAGNMVVDATEVDQDSAEVLKRPKFLDDTKFFTTKDASGNTLKLLDPWGNPYIYWYKWEATPDAWDVFGFHLYSTGPNGEEANNAIKDKIDNPSGVIENDFRTVADAEGIIFAGE
jgi:prepilin-type N-terminal cleavage/methylation domain-containing protein